MYTKHDWQDGELITKSLMNNIEKGIEDANNRAMTPGPQGENGQSAYELWKSQEGNSDKTEDDFLNSLKGEKGEKGDAGQQLEHINNATGQSDAHTVLNSLLAGLIAKGYMKGA